MRADLRINGALSRGAFAVAVLVSMAVLFTPADGVPFAPPGVDKAVHAALFGALALTGWWAGLHRRPLAALLVLYAALSEVVQGVTPLQRSASVGDLLADVVGVLAGLLLAGLLERRVASRPPTR